jgi:pimeloyl-ACP methyl ester carboxylesterase
MMARILSGVGFRVVTLDNRGSGQTKITRPFTIDDFCSDVIKLWDSLGITKSSLLGISMGGFISQAIAIGYPHRVSSLILVSSAPEERYINAKDEGWTSEAGVLEGRLRAYFAPGFVERNPVLFKTMVGQIRGAIESSDFTERSRLQRAAMSGHGWVDDLHRITCPTLIIHGEQDKVIGVEAAEHLAESIKDAILVKMPSVGHLLLAEAPKELYRLVQEFLEESRN